MSRLTRSCTQALMVVGLSFTLAGLASPAFGQSDTMKKDEMMKKEGMAKEEMKKKDDTKKKNTMKDEMKTMREGA